MLGNGWNRVVSEKSAREFEKSLKLPDGYIDRPMFPAPVEAIAAQVATFTADTPVTYVSLGNTQAPVVLQEFDTPLADIQAMSLALVAQTIKDVNRILQTEKVNITIYQFSKLLAIEVVDASENGFKVRESHVKQMLEMIK